MRRAKTYARTRFSATAIVAWFVLSACIACGRSDPARIPLPPPVPVAPSSVTAAPAKTDSIATDPVPALKPAAPAAASTERESPAEASSTPRGNAQRDRRRASKASTPDVVVHDSAEEFLLKGFEEKTPAEQAESDSIMRGDGLHGGDVLKQGPRRSR